MKYAGILIAILIALSTVTAVEEEKIISVDIGFTVDKTMDENNNTIVKFKAESDQNSYEFTLDKDTDSFAANKTFMTIRKLQCETEGIINLTQTLAEMNTKVYNEQCADVEGISYKWRWEGLRENYRKCEDELNNCTGDLKTSQAELSDKQTEITNRINAYSTLEVEKQKASSSVAWYFITGAALVSVIWYIKTRKAKPDQGPAEEGFSPF